MFTGQAEGGNLRHFPKDGMHRAHQCANPLANGGLADNEARDFERYLDATRSTFLYAKKVILIEGPAELFLIPPLIHKVLNVDLDSLGICVVPIYGKHFRSYVKMFKDELLCKKCAVITDGDMQSELPTGDEEDFGKPEEFSLASLDALKTDWVNVFYCRSTFEKALTIVGLLPILEKTVSEFGATRSAAKIKVVSDAIRKGGVGTADQAKMLVDLGEIVLKVSKRFDKARFAQAASKHIALAQDMPEYIKEAVKWIVAA